MVGRIYFLILDSPVPLPRERDISRDDTRCALFEKTQWRKPNKGLIFLILDSLLLSSLCLCLSLSFFLSLSLSLSVTINIKGKVRLQMFRWLAVLYYPASCKTEKPNLPLIRIMNAGNSNFENSIHQICPTFYMTISWKKFARGRWMGTNSNPVTSSPLPTSGSCLEWSNILSRSIQFLLGPSFALFTLSSNNGLS